MKGKEILYLIEKLETNTISPHELRKLKSLFHTGDSKILLLLMRQKFDEISASSHTLSDYKNKDRVKERLIKHLQAEQQSPLKRVNRLYWITGIAAACIIVGFLFFSKKSTNNVQKLEWISISTKHGERKQATLSD